MIREHVECRYPAEVEPAKWRTHRSHKSTAGFTHNGLSSSDEVLCASGRAGVGVSSPSNESEVKLPTPPSIPCCRLFESAIEREVAWGVGITCLGGVRTKFVRFIRADGKVARGGNDVLRSTKGCYCCCVAGRLRLGGSARATTTRGRGPLPEFYGDAVNIPPSPPIPRPCALVFASLVLAVVRLERLA